jgi:hypothetical protein
MLQVIQTGGMHLSRQPFPSVEADLNGKGEPSLNAGIEEAEDGMNLVVVEEQAFARAQLQLQFFRQAIAVSPVPETNTISRCATDGAFG